MPVKRRIAKRRREELDDCQRAHLLTGWFAVGLSGYLTRYRTREEFAAAWEQYREELLPEFIAKHPGHRPFAWWLLDHGKERPMNADGIAWTAKHGDYLRYSCRFTETFGFLHKDQWQVDETDYLREQGLLIDGEAAAIERNQAAEAERRRLWDAGAAERRAKVSWMYAD